MSDKPYEAIHQNTLRNLKGLSAAAPELTRAFTGLYQAALKPGALDARTKELIALGISIAKGCDGCIASHVKAALKAGATREEIIECIGVAVMMAGGPGMIYAGHAFEALGEQ